MRSDQNMRSTCQSTWLGQRECPDVHSQKHTMWGPLVTLCLLVNKHQEYYSYLRTMNRSEIGGINQFSHLAGPTLEGWYCIASKLVVWSRPKSSVPIEPPECPIADSHKEVTSCSAALYTNPFSAQMMSVVSVELLIFLYTFSSQHSPL